MYQVIPSSSPALFSLSSSETGSSPALARGALQNSEAPPGNESNQPSVADSFSFADGLTVPLEVGFLPSIDPILRLAVDKALDEAREVTVEGIIQRGAGPDAPREAIRVTYVPEEGGQGYYVHGHYIGLDKDVPKGVEIQEMIRTTGPDSSQVEGLIQNLVAGEIVCPWRAERLTFKTGENRLTTDGEVALRMGKAHIHQVLTSDPDTKEILNIGQIGPLTIEERLKSLGDGKFAITGTFGEEVFSGTVRKNEDGTIFIERTLGDLTIREIIRAN
ncbi:MAG: hypothetical protein HYU64_03600 [Armatimonadetes bacterium]|nr:hypothetical protein [Armatimonadota bacterium]